MSPNYPLPYENDLDCRWTIKAPAGNIIALTISEFHTYRNGRDNLYIYHGKNIHGAIVRTLTKSESMPLSSTGDSLYLKFSTDSSNTEKGFKIKVDAVGKYTEKIIDACVSNIETKKHIDDNCSFLLIVPCTGDGGSTGDGQGQGSCKTGLFCMESGLCLGTSGFV